MLAIIPKKPLPLLRSNNYENGTMIRATDFQGNFQYENGVLQFITQPEGYIYKDATGYRYVYQYKDHLGNNRLSFMRNAGTVAIVKEINYYPFGLTQKGYNNITTSLGSAGAKKYLYNGKELQEDYGLDWYDYGARFYDAQLGRWFVPDPLAEKAPSWSPYRYAFDNPVSIIDPNGMSEDWFENEKTGEVYYDPTLKKGDEGQLGKDWVHMGKNGMFGVDDQVLIMSNSDKAKTGFVEVPVSDPNTGNKIGKIPLRTALFQGDNAKSFMGEQGYNFQPIIYNFHSDVTTDYLPDADLNPITISHDNSSIEQVLASQYIHQDLVLKNTLKIGNYKRPINGMSNLYGFGPAYSIRNQSWTVRKDVYGTHALGRNVGRVINWLEKNTPWKSEYKNIWEKMIK